MEQEIENIKKAYEYRKNDESLSNLYEGSYAIYMVEERENVYKKCIQSHFSTIQTISFLEIGAGMGGNLPFFNSLGIPYKNMVANELLDERAIELKKKFDEVEIIKGDALAINSNRKFDILFQSTVFTSILNDEFRLSLAKKMWDLLNDNGIILWYDFTFNNPKNKNVKKVTKKEIKNMFPRAKSYHFYKVTLAPPLGRKIGKLYPLINKLSFLRTHIVAVIKK